MFFNTRFSAAQILAGGFVLIGAQAMSSPALAEEGFYVGLNGGMNSFYGGDSGTDVAGGNNNGSLYSIDGDSGSLLGVAVGYKFSNLWRADISYTRLNNELDWKGAFPGGGDSAYTSDASSDVFMLNGYLHAKGFDEDKFATFDPFIGAGIGFTINRQDNIVESTATTGREIADVRDGKKVEPAFRLGVGLDANVTPSLTLTSSVDAYWIGDFETGDGRDRVTRGYQEIGEWKTDDVVSVGISVGLRYAF